MNYPLYYAFEGAAPPARTGASHATIYPYGPFPAGNGATVMLGLQNEREWVLFCDKVLLRPEIRWTEVDTPAGAIPALLPPGMSRSDAPRMDAVPALGQHSESILAELGYSAQQIAAMRDAEAI